MVEALALLASSRASISVTLSVADIHGDRFTVRRPWHHNDVQERKGLGGEGCHHHIEPQIQKAFESHISSMISSKKIPSDTFGIFLGYLDSAPLPLHAVCACEVFADPTGDLRSYGQGALTRAMSSPYAPAPTQ